MSLYSAAYRHVPVNWIVGSLNILTGIFGICGWTFERIWSFLNAIWYNICGFDKYFVFMDDSPVAIPYWYFNGYSGKNVWLYDARNRVFYGCINEEDNKKENLPVLSMELIWKKYDEDHGSDMSDWLENVTFYTNEHRFPHPLQLLTAWSLDSRFWPATKKDSGTIMETINAQTGDTQFIELYQTVCEHKWFDFDHEQYEDECEEKADHEDSGSGSGSGSCSCSSCAEIEPVSDTSSEPANAMTESQHPVRDLDAVD